MASPTFPSVPLPFPARDDAVEFGPITSAPSPSSVSTAPSSSTPLNSISATPPPSKANRVFAPLPKLGPVGMLIRMNTAARVMSIEANQDSAEALRSLLNSLALRCPTCWVNGRDELEPHIFVDCPHSQAYKAAYFAWKGAIKYAKNCCCFYCAVPQHANLHQRPQPSQPRGSQCVWPDIVIPIAYAVWNDVALRRAMQIRFRTNHTSLGAYGEWLGLWFQPAEQFYNAARVVLWLKASKESENSSASRGK